jgi:alkanesulfonate monooxygenase SsuD/methylene tetrahydromethanopterin reductase-like flavin-dependent oxidoreductase (luciferase family)
LVVPKRIRFGYQISSSQEADPIAAAKIDRSAERVPMLVGGNGASLLAHAGAHADIIGLQGLGRTHDDGHRHDVKWAPSHLDAQIEQVRVGAGNRFDDIELSALVQVVDMTDRREATIAQVCKVLEKTPDDVRQVPYVLVGTVDEVVEKIKACRERWGITYFTVRELDSFAPVIDAFRGAV